jgi:hypothetical protein
VSPALDWSAPWLAPLAPLGRAVQAAWAAGDSLAQALNRQAAIAGVTEPRFVPQSALPAGVAYEAYIARSGQVPTRDNLHDLFNGLVWLTQPALKRRMNRLQAGHIAAHGVGPRRGPLRDALTLFDENGAWLDAPLPLARALVARDWGRAFETLRPLWRQARLQLTGHALIEQLATAPRPALTAHVLLADPMALDEAGWAAKSFVPLPVLGVPGW